MRTKTYTRMVQAVAAIAGLLLLLWTWHGMFWWVAGLTEGLLVPWDTTAQRPALGTLARTVNDFFEDAPGALIPAVAVVGASALVGAIGTWRARRRWPLPAALAVANCVYALVAVPLWVAVRALTERGLPPPQTGYDLGYHRTWPTIAVSVVLLGLLLWAQARVVAVLGRGRPQARDT